MNFQPLSLSGLYLIEPQVFGDERGFFMETYHQKLFQENGLNAIFAQDNHSRSTKNILRGLHLQLPPFSQTKLVRVTKGKVLDIVIDVRPASSTFKKYEAVELSEENKKMLYIPQGFLHGFLTLSDQADFQYKVDNYYNKDSELGVIWNDPTLALPWPIKNPIVSQKDSLLSTFLEAQEQFKKFTSP